MDKIYEGAGDFARFFQCKLHSLHENGTDLFIPGDGWNSRFSRATFNTGWGDRCETHPYYGLERRFALRGFTVALTMSPITFTPSIREMCLRNLDGPEHFTYDVEVRVNPDSQASNASALAVPEVCEAGFFLDKDGELVEQVQYYPEGD